MKVRKSKDGEIKLSLKSKFALACFMEAVPQLIELWKSHQTLLSFDEWLRSIHDEHKKNNERRKNNP